MTAKEINKSIKTMHLHLSKSERFDHWFNFTLLLVPLSLIGWVTIETAIQNNEFSFFSLILIAAIILLLRHKMVCTKLNVYKSNLTEEQFKDANEAAAKLNDWLVMSNRRNYFSAIRQSNWHWDGIKITAFIKNDKLYMNSMANPCPRTSPFTFGLNNRNKIELIRQYQSILNGNDVKEIANNEIAKREKEFWNESEWTFKNIFIRIIGYGFSIILILVSIWIILEGNIQGLILGITVIGFCVSYIIYDINMIRQKKKKARL